MPIQVGNIGHLCSVITFPYPTTIWPHTWIAPDGIHLYNRIISPNLPWLLTHNQDNMTCHLFHNECIHKLNILYISKAFHLYHTNHINAFNLHKSYQSRYQIWLRKLLPKFPSKSMQHKNTKFILAWLTSIYLMLPS